MFAFWLSVALISGRYHGHPTARYLFLPVDARHFDLWLALFAQTAHDIRPQAAAERFILLSCRKAEPGLANSLGAMLGKGEQCSAGSTHADGT